MSLKKKVVIIDYQLGNLFSVKQACDVIGINSTISSYKEDILNADALILPGVGAFNSAMNNLINLDLVNAIKEKVLSGYPIFGICLGLQLLFSKSEEFESGVGLELINGIVKRFPKELNGEKIKVPHMGWNKIDLYESQSWKSTPLNTLSDGSFMYFVHSYFIEPFKDSIKLSLTDYNGVNFCSSINYKNIFATQFHPEKSAEDGLLIYKNWAELNKLI